MTLLRAGGGGVGGVNHYMIALKRGREIEGAIEKFSGSSGGEGGTFWGKVPKKYIQS